jgi:hypothetical protein
VENAVCRTWKRRENVKDFGGKVYGKESNRKSEAKMRRWDQNGY